MRKVAALIVVSVLLTIALCGCLGEQPRGYSATDLVAPEPYYYSPTAGIAPTPSTSSSPGCSYAINWTWTEVYAVYGGVMNLTLANTGSTRMFVYGYGLRWNDSATEYWRNCSALIDPGNSADLGMLGFDGPHSAGDFFYHILVKIAAYNQGAHAWKDYGAEDAATRLAEVMPLDSERQYRVESNVDAYYDRVNSLLNFSAAQPVADIVRAQTTADYSMAQIAYTYEWVRGHIAYKDDPTDYWQNSAETLSWRTGDCEDFAILVASVVHDLGGDARVNIIDEHAFATVFVGANASCIEGVQQSLDSFYGTSLKITYLQDDLGYWLVVDPTGEIVAGGLPTLAGPTLAGGNMDAWTFDSTTVLSKVDALGPSSTSGRLLPWF